jgi:uncharacterized repeat protein (TIGR02543 family)
MKRFFFIFLFALTALVFAGCGGGGGSSSGGGTGGGGGGGGGEGEQCSLSFYDGNGTEYADLRNTVNCGTEITLPKDKTREGYTLQGWLSNGTDDLFTDKYTANSDTVFNAKWKSDNPNITEYTVYFYEDSSLIPVLTKTVKENSWIFLVPLEKEGYIFNGWEFDGTVYRSTVPYTVKNNTTFVAVWTQRNPEEFEVVLYDNKLDYKETLTLQGGKDVISSLPSGTWYRERGTLPIGSLVLDKDITLYALPNVHEVSDETELNAVRYNLSHNYILVDNIELTELTLDGAKGWTPIGDALTNSFSGIFNGNGHRISGLFIDIAFSSDEESHVEIYTGLFGYLTGTVKNLGVDPADNGIKIDLYIPYQIYSSSGSFVGGIAGYVKNGTIENCYFIGDITSSSSSYDSEAYVGGIAGYVENGTIEGCYFIGVINSSSSSLKTSSPSYAGGIAGVSYGYGYGYSFTIKNCYFIGDITSSSSSYSTSDSYAGGITGDAGSGTIENCYSMGNITSFSTSSRYTFHSYAGGIAGEVDSVTIKDSYSIGDISSTTSSTTSDSSSSSYAGGIAGKIYGTAIENCYSIGDVTSSSPTPTSIVPAAYAGGIAGHSFGNGKIENCYSKGDINSFSANYESSAGGIVGGVYGGLAIKNCHSIGNITATNISDSDAGAGFSSTAGGIAGQGDIIENCYSIGNITATSNGYSVAGGIAGDADTIKDSYSIGDITATAVSNDADYTYSEAAAGGIAGYSGTIENSYSIGDITAIADTESAAGGIAGYYYDTIENCAALNENINSTYVKGRIVGNASGSSLTNNFANSGMLLNGYPVTGTAGDKEGEGKALSLFEDQDIYETDLGWEFGNNGDALIWKMPSVGTGYPILYWQ